MQKKRAQGGLSRILTSLSPLSRAENEGVLTSLFPLRVQIRKVKRGDSDEHSSLDPASPHVDEAEKQRPPQYWIGKTAVVQNKVGGQARDACAEVCIRTAML